MTKLNCKYDLRNLSILCFLFLAALFVFSCYTSPLYPNFFGYDSAIFSLMGKGIVEGKSLYTELFDHKGPVIFYINALGHAIGGRSGIFFLQCISMLVTVVLLYYTGKKLRPSRKYQSSLECIILFVCGMIPFFYTFESGNLTEEYSLPIISASCYLFVSYLVHAEDDPRHPPAHAMFHGIGLGILSLLRLNNTVTICAGILYIAIYLCYKKQYKNLLWNLLAGILGVVLIFIPVLVFFHLHSSLTEMIYATFLHNFKIAGNTGHVSVMSRPKQFVILYLPMALSAVFLLTQIFKNRRISVCDGFFGCILTLNFACLWIANRFPHYFTLFTPVYLVFLFRYLQLNRNPAIIAAALICAAMHLYPTLGHVAANVETVFFNNNPRYTSVQSSMAKIPSEEQDSVIGFEITAADYLAGDILPCYKYYTLQTTWSITAPNIIPEFINWITENEPLWLLVSKEYVGAELNQILCERYEDKFEDEYIIFYRLIEPEVSIT